ncbi:MAG: DUF1887 family CARF protein [Bacteroidales bacterium]|nr:DUF1887 family CARF protein [Bacteroidales bacterium]
MSKTLVNIITEERPMSAYLFIREMYEDGDSLMFISAKDTEDDLNFLSSIWKVPGENIETILLRNDRDEDAYELICRNVVTHLNHETNYYVNLAGGTRYMALAIQRIFEKFNAKYFYVNVEDNKIVETVFNDSIYDNDDYFYPIRYRMMLKEYFDLHKLANDLNRRKYPIRSEMYTQGLYDVFTKVGLDSSDSYTLRQLREYRNKKTKTKISQMEHPVSPKGKAVPNLSQFLKKIHFQETISNYLLQEEVEYLTGGWLEEYLYNVVKKLVKPDDIALGVRIYRKNMPQHDNELDVVFTKNNRLFVMECKTGFVSEKMFNEVVYKCCALKDALLGLTSHSYIFSLKKDETGKLSKIASNMEVTFCDGYYVQKPSRLKNLIRQAIKL